MPNKNFKIEDSALKTALRPKNLPFRAFVGQLLIIGNLLFIMGCSFSSEQDKNLNHLKDEKSLYLLQHASNPIDWYPWGDEAINKAKSENKLLVISIGYYACHWCQVMEKETFTDTTVAKLMNDNYISIKVDREERPDIDQVYSEAAKKMTGSSGWPLNVIATPDGAPLFAGTYFENSDWQAIIQRASYLYEENPEEIITQAQNLAESLKAEIENNKPGLDLSLEEIESIWLAQSDSINGGIRGSQKFPNSPYLSALLDFTYYEPNDKLDRFLIKTLDNMALGGMFDHLGGGFTRYATDELWQIPHFEKMLYDNAQLMGIYAKAYRKFNDPFYLYIAERTADCLLNEFKNRKGGFYSSINAVSDEEEGGYYTWTKQDIAALDNADQVNQIFNISEAGNWEKGQNVLYTKELSKEEYLNVVNQSVIDELLKVRSKRTSPPKDKKIITGWNALALEGFVELYRATNSDKYLSEAKALADYLTDNHIENDEIKRTNDQSDVGFLEDYAELSKGLITLYQVTFDEKWAKMAEKVTASMLASFQNSASPFLSQSTASADLFMKTYPTLDTDLPSGNAQAAGNLIFLSELFYDTRSDWKTIAEGMISTQQAEIKSVAAFTGTWIQSLLTLENPPYEVAIVGDEAVEIRKTMDTEFRPDIIFLGGKEEGEIPLLMGKLIRGKTMIYVCQNKTCRFPTNDPEKAYELTISEE